MKMGLIVMHIFPWLCQFLGTLLLHCQLDKTLSHPELGEFFEMTIWFFYFSLLAGITTLCFQNLGSFSFKVGKN